MYDPLEHLDIEKTISNNKICNVLIPSSSCPKKLISDIYNYFAERNEDEGYLE